MVVTVVIELAKLLRTPLRIIKVYYIYHIISYHTILIVWFTETPAFCNKHIFLPVPVCAL